MPVFFLTSDILFGSRVSQTAGPGKVEIVGSPAMLVDRLAACPTAAPLVILDLSSPYDVHAVAAAVKGLATPPRSLLAYAPHVHVERLKGAREAGCDQVLTRGEFNARFAEIVRQAAEEESGSVPG